MEFSVHSVHCTSSTTSVLSGKNVEKIPKTESLPVFFTKEDRIAELRKQVQFHTEQIQTLEKQLTMLNKE
jgi:hypothetical protein